MVGDAQGSDVPIHLLGKETAEETAEEKPEEVRNDFIYLVDVEKRREQ